MADSGVFLPCRRCGAEFRPASARHEFCSNDCRLAERDAGRGTASVRNRFGLNPGDLGALSELRVCVDLAERGYSVFRALSPSAPCDLIALAPDGAVLRVEVKTGYRGLRHGSEGPISARSVYDVLAIAHPDGVEYRPFLLGDAQVRVRKFGPTGGSENGTA